MNLFYTSAPAAVQALSLSSLVRSIVTDALPAAAAQHTRIVNEVEKNLLLGEGATELKRVLTDLLMAVIRNSNDGDIHISAERFRDMVMLHIEERNNYNGYALSFSVGSLEPDAAKIGGHISMEGVHKREAHISFSFPGQFAA